MNLLQDAVKLGYLDVVQYLLEIAHIDADIMSIKGEVSFEAPSQVRMNVIE